MLVFRCVHVPPELVGSSPHLVLETEIGTVDFFSAMCLLFSYSALQNIIRHFYRTNHDY
jgi:hypothetical protein